MSLHFRRSAGFGRLVRLNVSRSGFESRWQAVALEIAEGLCKAVLLIGSIVASIFLGIVVAAMSSQL